MPEVRHLRPPAAVSDLVKQTMDHINSSLAIVARTHMGRAADHEIRERCFVLLRESMMLLSRPVEHGTSEQPDDDQMGSAEVEFWLNWLAARQASLEESGLGQTS